MKSKKYRWIQKYVIKQNSLKVNRPIINILIITLGLWAAYNLYDFLLVPHGYGINEKAAIHLSGFITGVVFVIAVTIRFIINKKTKKGQPRSNPITRILLMGLFAVVLFLLLFLGYYFYFMMNP